MSSSRLATRTLKRFSCARPCVFCHSRQYAQVCTIAATTPSIRPSGRAITGSVRAYATASGQKLDLPRIRADVDERSRIGFYALSQQQGSLLMDRVKANSIAKEFLARKKTMDHGSNVKGLASKYRVSIEDLASLAIVTFRIPDLSDAKKRAMLAPSIHKPLAGSMLQGCAQQQDPLAIMQILTAVYLAGSSDGAQYKDLASLFPPSEIVNYRKTLAQLGAKSKTFALGPEVLTLQGLFLEREGKRDEAEALYLEAVERCHFKFNPKTRHPMQIELLTPWNALAYFYKNDPSPARQAQAKKYFERGALEGDDPLSCYELASYEDKSDPRWLKFTSKAAASGHRQAAVDLAEFYREASAPNSPVLANSKTQNMLNWLTSWRKGSTVMLAHEWLQAASIMGHKPSTLKLAEHYQSQGDKERAKEYWWKLTEPPSTANQVEEWPQLVQIGRKRLAGIRT